MWLISNHYLVFCTQGRNAPSGRGDAETGVRRQKATVKAAVKKAEEKAAAKGRGGAIRGKRRLQEDIAIEGRRRKETEAGSDRRKRRRRRRRVSKWKERVNVTSVWPKSG